MPPPHRTRVCTSRPAFTTFRMALCSAPSMLLVRLDRAPCAAPALTAPARSARHGTYVMAGRRGQDRASLPLTTRALRRMLLASLVPHGTPFTSPDVER